MPITQAVCLSYKTDLWDGIHQVGDVYKMALYLASATLDKTTAAYTATAEITDPGYTAGGITLSNRQVLSATDARSLVWDDTLSTPVSWSAAGALIYNATRSNKALCVLSFGGTIVSTNGPFVVDFPADLLKIP